MGLPALKDELAPIVRCLGSPAKVIALRARVSERTVEAVKQAEHGINAETLIAFGRAYPEIKALVIELMGGVETDPAYLMHLLQKHIEAKQ